jgi:GTP 3',8-cyclase
MGWKILRLLITDKCNYSCEFCHLEGQEKKARPGHSLELQELFQVVAESYKYGVREIQISGGEPVLSKNFIPLLQNLGQYSDLDIGFATNGSRLDIETIGIIKDNFVSVNINMPSANSTRYTLLTGGGNLSKVLNTIRLLMDENIPICLNTVLMPGLREDCISAIDLAKKLGLKIKILPQLFTDVVAIQKETEWFMSYATTIGTPIEATNPQRLRWEYDVRGFTNEIHLLQNPCNLNQCDLCLDYGEIRLQPDGALMPCIKENKKTNSVLDEFGRLDIFGIQSKLERTWIEFSQK